MPRWSQKPSQPSQTPPVSLTSAAVVDWPRKERKAEVPVRSSSNWQSRAWGAYDRTGELRYATNWYANALSKGRLYVGRRTPSGIERVESGPEVDALAELTNGGDREPQILAAMGQHLFVAGEWYLVGRTATVDDELPAGEDLWEIVSTEEYSGGQVATIKREGRRIELTEADSAIRMWKPHPRDQGKPDSPVKANLEVFEELHLLDLHVKAQIRSRLAGAGLLVLPSEVSFPPAPGEAPAESDSTNFLRRLGQAMMEPLGDPGSAAALVPLMLQAPGEVLEKIQHLTFWSDLDDRVITLRQDALRRAALGLDMPPEVLMGTADLNHWGAWQVDESSIKSHIEPAFDILTSNLTTGFLRAVQGENVDPSKAIFVDTTALRMRPNRSREAIEIWDRGELSAEALMRETGFDPAGDSPDKEERKEWLLRKIASGSATPEQVEAAARMLGVPIETSEVGGDTREARPAPSLVQHPQQEPPVPEGMAAACDMLVLRALERAGNRIKSKFNTRPVGVASHEVYRLTPPPRDSINDCLSDAWPNLEYAVERYGYAVEPIRAALDAYTRSLLITQREHSYEEMCTHLEKAIGA